MYHISTISDILRQGVDSLAQWLEQWISTPAVRVRIPSGTWDFFQTMHHFLVTNFHIRKMGAPPGLNILCTEFILNLKQYVLFAYQQKATMSFKLEDFIAASSQELLNLAKKSDLLDIAIHYSIPSVKTSMLKHEIKNIIIQFFVDEEIFEPSATSHIMVSQTDLQLKELEFKRQL